MGDEGEVLVFLVLQALAPTLVWGLLPGDNRGKRERG